MKGLLMKDWYVAIKSCRTHIIIVVCMSVLSLVTDTGLLYLLYPMMFAGMIPVYVLSVDEKWEWGRYAQTLPVTRREVVASKYIGVLITAGGTALFMTLLWLGRFILDGGGSGLWALLRTMWALLSFGLLFPALMLPGMLRFGVEKGRFIIMAVSAVAVGVVMGALFAVSDGAPGGMQTAYVMDITGRVAWLVPAIGLGVLVLFALSWLLSVRIYEQREL